MGTTRRFNMKNLSSTEKELYGQHAWNYGERLRKPYERPYVLKNRVTEPIGSLNRFINLLSKWKLSTQNNLIAASKGDQNRGRGRVHTPPLVLLEQVEILAMEDDAGQAPFQP